MSSSALLFFLLHCLGFRESPCLVAVRRPSVHPAGASLWMVEHPSAGGYCSQEEAPQDACPYSHHDQQSLFVFCLWQEQPAFKTGCGFTPARHLTNNSSIAKVVTVLEPRTILPNLLDRKIRGRDDGIVSGGSGQLASAHRLFPNSVECPEKNRVPAGCHM